MTQIKRRINLNFRDLHISTVKNKLSKYTEDSFYIHSNYGMFYTSDDFPVNPKNIFEYIRTQKNCSNDNDSMFAQIITMLSSANNGLNDLENFVLTNILFVGEIDRGLINRRFFNYADELIQGHLGFTSIFPNVLLLFKAYFDKDNNEAIERLLKNIKFIDNSKFIKNEICKRTYHYDKKEIKMFDKFQEITLYQIIEQGFLTKELLDEIINIVLDYSNELKYSESHVLSKLSHNLQFQCPDSYLKLVNMYNKTTDLTIIEYTLSSIIRKTRFPAYTFVYEETNDEYTFSCHNIEMFKKIDLNSLSKSEIINQTEEFKGQLCDFLIALYDIKGNMKPKDISYPRINLWSYPNILLPNEYIEKINYLKKYFKNKKIRYSSNSKVYASGHHNFDIKIIKDSKHTNSNERIDEYFKTLKSIVILLNKNKDIENGKNILKDLTLFAIYDHSPGNFRSGRYKSLSVNSVLNSLKYKYDLKKIDDIKNKIYSNRNTQRFLFKYINNVFNIKANTLDAYIPLTLIHCRVEKFRVNIFNIDEVMELVEELEKKQLT